MKQHYFCTLFDSRYLLKGLAMLRSLARACPNAFVFVLCMDQMTQSILERLHLPSISCIPLTDIEDDALLAAKASRTTAEYCWTLSSCLTWYVLQQHPEIDCITYIDADLLFYSAVQPLFDEIGDASIVIIEHRFSERLKYLEVNGRFCVEWVGFRRDEQGMACLKLWRQQCINWCYYRLEDGKMGDQKYLDIWPDRYSDCHILQHPGAGIAPWNYEQYAFGKDESLKITVQGVPLIFYHFHQFKILKDGKFDRLSEFYSSRCPEPESVYSVYEATLRQCFMDVYSIAPEFEAGFLTEKQSAISRLKAILPLGIKVIIPVLNLLKKIQK